MVAKVTTTRYYNNNKSKSYKISNRVSIFAKTSLMNATCSQRKMKITFFQVLYYFQYSDTKITKKRIHEITAPSVRN